MEKSSVTSKTRDLGSNETQRLPHQNVRLFNAPKINNQCVIRNVRKVKVQLEGQSYLNLAEVQVFYFADNNVALTRPATQSSTYLSRHASAAVDGNVNSYSQTKLDQGKDTHVGLLIYRVQNMYPDFAMSVSNPRCMVGG